MQLIWQQTGTSGQEQPEQQPNGVFVGGKCPELMNMKRFPTLFLLRSLVPAKFFFEFLLKGMQSMWYNQVVSRSLSEFSTKSSEWIHVSFPLSP